MNTNSTGRTFKRSLASFVLALAMVISLMPVLPMVAYAADEYTEIYTVDDLYNVRNNMSGNYKLMADIDLTEVVAEGGRYNYSSRGWEPYGATTSTEFTGVFDGNGHTISGLRIVGTINEQNGLFWKNGGTIKNLTVKGTINFQEGSTSTSVSAFIAGTNNGTIANCRVNGSINVEFCRTVGYIAGINNGSISKCLTQGTLSFCGTNGNWGGICGYSKGASTITECVNAVTISPKYGYQLSGKGAGISGMTDSSVIIENCYNTGTVKGSATETFLSSNGITGGSASVTNCYNVGELTVRRINGSNVYNSPVTGTACIGGGTRTNCYYLGTDGEGALNENQMKARTSYAGFDFENTWIIDSGADYKYPQLRNCRQDLGRAIDMIELKSAPDKLTYKTGDKFDPSGCVVTVFYKDNGSEDIDVTTDMLTGYDMSTPGIQDVVFEYRGYTLSFKINVNQRPEITGMTLTAEPLKTTFIRGTEFDFTGAIAQIQYKDGTTEDFLIDAMDCTGGDINTSGTYTITYTKFGYSVTFDVEVVPVREAGIHIETLPDKTSYIEGEDLDLTGMVVCVDYNSGASAPIENYTIADYDSSEGVQTITVQYNGFEATFEVSFAPKTVLSIEITKQPNKTEYVFGQTFDPTGMVVTANLDNGKTEEVTDYVVSPMQDVSGMQDLTVSYAGKITYVTVFVTPRALDSISVTTKPYKLTYIEGQEFDPEGMVVTAKYNDDTMEVITDYEMTKLGRTPGNKTIVISYQGKTTTLAVTVIAKTVVNLTVTAPDKVNYVKGEEFDPTGMVVTALYNDGTTAEVTDYRVAGFGESDEVNILEISYGGKVEHIVVTIHDPTEWMTTKQATCTESGTEIRECKECGELIESREIPALGHNSGEWTTIQEPTCTETGREVQKCTVCNQELDPRVIPAMGHTPGEWFTVQEPTCTENGSEITRCLVCKEELDSREIAALGHNWGEWVTVKQATYTESGMEQRLCTKCDAVDKRPTPMLEQTSITNATVTGIANKTYTGSAIKPTPVVKVDGKTLVKDTDYTVAYKSNTNVGLATVTITGKDAYKGTITKTFKINPKGKSLSSVAAGSKSFTAKWTKQATKMKTSYITGYEIQYSTSSKFTSGSATKSVKVSGYTKVSKKVTNLKASKKYYVRMRTYKTVSGKTYYSTWSSAKTVTTKK